MSGAARPLPAAARPARTYTGLAAVAAAVIAADQVSKAVVSSALVSRHVDILGGAVRLIYAHNTGAAFSLLPGGGALFAAVAVVVSAGIVVYYHRVATGPVALRLGLALILGGAIGNLIDRLRLGYVVDFIDLRWWPVFNLADSAVVVGVALLVLRSLLSGMSSGE